jgi:hypothetical protein
MEAGFLLQPCFGGDSIVKSPISSWAMIVALLCMFYSGSIASVHTILSVRTPVPTFDSPDAKREHWNGWHVASELAWWRRWELQPSSELFLVMSALVSLLLWIGAWIAFCCWRGGVAPLVACGCLSIVVFLSSLRLEFERAVATLAEATEDSLRLLGWLGFSREAWDELIVNRASWLCLAISAVGAAMTISAWRRRV